MDNSPMAITLNKIERRILGVLLEKQLTQATSYPLTVNALLAGCNQKSNRFPFLELEEPQVLDALENLRRRNLVSLVLPGPGARTNRWQHELDQAFHWTKQERAIMGELLLRGPQTVGELRSRASRMTRFESLEAVQEVLDTLAITEPPQVAPMPREPGQSTIRYTHLLYPQGEKPATESTAGYVPRTESETPAVHEVPSDRGELRELREEMQSLREAIAELQARVRKMEGMG